MCNNGLLPVDNYFQYSTSDVYSPVANTRTRIFTDLQIWSQTSPTWMNRRAAMFSIIACSSMLLLCFILTNYTKTSCVRCCLLGLFVWVYFPIFPCQNVIVTTKVNTNCDWGVSDSLAKWTNGKLTLHFFQFSLRDRDLYRDFPIDWTKGKRVGNPSIAIYYTWPHLKPFNNNFNCVKT